MTVRRAVARLRTALAAAVLVTGAGCRSAPLAETPVRDPDALAFCQPNQILHIENLTGYEVEIVQLDAKNEGMPIAVVGRGTHDFAIQHFEGNRYLARQPDGDPIPRPDQSRIRLSRRCP